MKYPDTVILVDPVVDSYGTPKIGRMETVAAIVGPSTGFTQGANQAEITADAIAYINPSDSYVSSTHNRLEGMYLITSEGEDQTDAWYQIDSVEVGRKSLTTYQIDNILVRLTKSASLPSLS